MMTALHDRGELEAAPALRSHWMVPELGLGRLPGVTHLGLGPLRLAAGQSRAAVLA